MSLDLIIGPDPIFKKTANPVAVVDDEIRELCDDLTAMLYEHNAVGAAAPMVGILKRIIVVDLQEDGVKNPFAMINPEIITRSDETQIFEEGSICFPEISAEIRRAKSINVKYLNECGSQKTMEAEGYLASVIQHELDYLDGIIYLDHLSAVRRNMLLKKAKKIKLKY